MFYKKDFADVKRTKKKVTFHRFSVGQAAGNGVLCSLGTNCECADEKIERGIGLVDYTAATGETLTLNDPFDLPAVFGVFKKKMTDGTEKEYIAYVSEQKWFYVYEEATERFSPVRQLPEIPTMLTWVTADGTMQLVLFSSYGVWCYDRENGLVLRNALETGTDACIFHERAFAVTQPYTVRYCAPLEIGDWSGDADQGGYIELPADEGKIVGMVTLKEAVYIFREKNILRLSARGGARDFVVDRMGYGGGKILKGTVENCGEKIFFLAEDGAYAFDGSTSYRVCQSLDISPVGGGQGFNHGFVDGKYLVRYTDRKNVKKLLVIDAISENGYFAFSDAVGLSNVYGGVICYSDKTVKMFSKDGDLPDGEKSIFQASSVDFGVRDRKLVREIRLKGVGGGTLTLESEETNESTSFVFSDGFAKIATACRGDLFNLTIDLDEHTKICEIEIALEKIG
jgi:hypothetical protein